MFSREGFTIDVVAGAARRWLLNPAAAVPLAVALAYYPPVVARLLQHITPYQAGKLQSYVRRLATISVVLALNDWLNKQFANNWTADRDWRWDHEIVLVTGGSSGLGASICQGFIARNAATRIIVVDVAPLKWKPADGARVDFYACDLSDSAAIRETCARIREECGHPTVLFNNAGLCRGVTLIDGTYADVEVTVRTNLTAPLLLAKEFLPHMVKRNHGHIINTGSMSSLVPTARIGDYSTTKAGITALHEFLQLELNNIHKAPKVRLTLGIFSFIRTPLLDGHTNQSAFLYPMLHVDSVGERLVEAAYSGYGSTIYMPGIMRYLAVAKGGPDWLFRLVREQTAKVQLNFTGKQEVDAATGRIVPPRAAKE